jgi:hypothetical protein
MSERKQFDKCVQPTREGPLTPAQTGEALHQVESERQFQQKNADTKTPFSRVTKGDTSEPQPQPPIEFSKLHHYSVQTPIYGLLLSALNLSSHYEILPGTEERQCKLENLVKQYQKTCDTLNEEAF